MIEFTYVCGRKYEVKRPTGLKILRPEHSIFKCAYLLGDGSAMFVRDNGIDCKVWRRFFADGTCDSKDVDYRIVGEFQESKKIKLYVFLVNETKNIFAVNTAHPSYNYYIAHPELYPALGNVEAIVPAEYKTDENATTNNSNSSG